MLSLPMALKRSSFTCICMDFRRDFEKIGDPGRNLELEQAGTGKSASCSLRRRELPSQERLSVSIQLGHNRGRMIRMGFWVCHAVMHVPARGYCYPLFRGSSLSPFAASLK